jgi:hypothetical protein
MNLGSRRLGAGCSTCGGGVNHPTNQCDERKVVSISKAGDSLIIALDDCTFFKADMSVLDACVCGDGTGANPADIAAMKALKDAVAKLQEKVTTLEAKEDKDTVYDDTAIRNLIEALQNKEDKDTVFDPTAINERLAALEAKEDKDTVFDPSALEARVTALENKADKDTVYDDTALAARVKALEDAPAGDRVDTTAFVRKSDLIDVANFAGTVRFKAYPADVAGGTEAAPITNLETDLDHL